MPRRSASFLERSLEKVFVEVLQDTLAGHGIVQGTGAIAHALVEGLEVTGLVHQTLGLQHGHQAA